MDNLKNAYPTYTFCKKNSKYFYANICWTELDRMTGELVCHGFAASKEIVQ